MEILQSTAFKKTVKNLYKNQIEHLEKAIRVISKDPLAGSAKTGDLTKVRVYKFYILKQLTLLAYTYIEETKTIKLLALGSHENFYKDLKIQIK